MFFRQSTHHPLESRDRLQNYHPDSNWFCSSRCEDVFIGLQKLLGKPFPVDETNRIQTMLKYSDELESYCQLKVAVEVMLECFEPVKDGRSGTDL